LACSAFSTAETSKVFTAECAKTAQRRTENAKRMTDDGYLTRAVFRFLSSVFCLLSSHFPLRSQRALRLTR
jgi:hypothetical protein